LDLQSGIELHHPYSHTISQRREPGHYCTIVTSIVRIVAIVIYRSRASIAAAIVAPASPPPLSHQHRRRHCRNSIAAAIVATASPPPLSQQHRRSHCRKASSARQIDGGSQ